MGEGGTASIAYAGAGGRHLLRHEAYTSPVSGALERLIAVTAGTSSYQALQFRYAGAFARHFFASVSYAWAHSIDDGSQDSSIFVARSGYRRSEDRGSSNFDVRHSLTAAMTYEVPREGLPAWLGGWSIAGIVRARSGFPIDIAAANSVLGLGTVNAGRPDLVPGQPIWLRDDAVAGHRRLNRAAFRNPASALGTLGRNTITGNRLFQWDTTIRRDFRLAARSSLEVGVTVFNVLNRPQFADPVPYLSWPWFGQSTSMQNLMLGSGSPNSGLASLFQPGGARSAEVLFRFSF